MKIYQALMKNEPINYGMTCWRVLDIEEIDVNGGPLIGDRLTQEFNRRIINEPGLTVMYFHLPTKDVKEMVDNAV